MNEKEPDKLYIKNKDILDVCMYFNREKTINNKTNLMKDFQNSIQIKLKKNIYWISKLNQIKPQTNIVIMFAYFNNQNDKDCFQLYNQLKEKGVIFLHIDSDPLVSYPHNFYSNYYFRLYINSVFRTKASFFLCEENDRWLEICKKKGIYPKPWKSPTENNYILVFNQNPNGFAAQGNNMEKWLQNILIEIRKYTTRKIVIRLKKKTTITNKLPNNTFISKNINITDDLKNAFITVSYNTTASFVSIFEGVPVYCSNPDSTVYELSLKDLSKIETPIYPERDEFFKKYAYTVWNYNEIKNGLVWTKLIKKIQNII